MKESRGRGLDPSSIAPPTGGGAGREDTSSQPMRRVDTERCVLFSFSWGSMFDFFFPFVVTIWSSDWWMGLIARIK